MAGCNVLYYDPTQPGRGPDAGWRPCPARSGPTPDQVLRFVCHAHRRQLVALHAAQQPPRPVLRLLWRSAA